MSVEISSDQKKSFLVIKVGGAFSLDDSTAFLSFTVENEYHIPNLKNYIVNKQFTDKDFIEFLADLSLSHTRGIQATLINGTNFNKLFIPVANLGAIRNESIG